MQGLPLTLIYAIFAELIKATGRLNSVLGLVGIREKDILIDESMRKILYFSASIAAFIFIFLPSNPLSSPIDMFWHFRLYG